MPKIASYQEATSGLQDVLHFLETKDNMKTANELAKVIANVQSDWLKQRRSQSKLKPFDLCNNCESVVSYNIENGSSRHYTIPSLSQQGTERSQCFFSLVLSFVYCYIVQLH